MIKYLIRDKPTFKLLVAYKMGKFYHGKKHVIWSLQLERYNTGSLNIIYNKENEMSRKIDVDLLTDIDYEYKLELIRSVFKATVV